MLRLFVVSGVAALSFMPAVKAQCLNRGLGDPSILQVRTQMNVTVPITPPDAGINATEEARKQLYAISSRECETLHKIYGGDCVLSSVTMTSSRQDSLTGGHTIFVSMPNVYTVKRAQNSKQASLRAGCCSASFGCCPASQCELSGPTF